MRFEYHRPSNLAEAIELLSQEQENRRPVAYGSDMLVWVKQKVRAPEAVVDLSHIEELHQIEKKGDFLVVGSAVTLAELAREEVVVESFGALSGALGTMGSVQLREGASVGGNICTASPAGDTGPPLLACDASFVVNNAGGWRKIPAREFYTGPGATVLNPGDVLTAIELPFPPPGTVGAYEKGARRKAVDLALVSVAAVASPASGTGREACAIGLGAVAPTPIRALEAEQAIAEHGLTDRGIEAAAEAARRDARPIDDGRATAAYRRDLVGQLTARALRRLASSLTEKK